MTSGAVSRTLWVPRAARRIHGEPRRRPDHQRLPSRRQRSGRRSLEAPVADQLAALSGLRARRGQPDAAQKQRGTSSRQELPRGIVMGFQTLADRRWDTLLRLAAQSMVRCTRRLRESVVGRTRPSPTESSTDELSLQADRLHTVSPDPIVQGADATIDFLKRVFGAVELRRFPGESGRLMHAEVRIDDTVIMLADPAPPTWELHPVPRARLRPGRGGDLPEGARSRSGLGAGAGQEAG